MKVNGASGETKTKTQVAPPAVVIPGRWQSQAPDVGASSTTNLSVLLVLREMSITKKPTFFHTGIK